MEDSFRKRIVSKYIEYFVSFNYDLQIDLHHIIRDYQLIC